MLDETMAECEQSTTSILSLGSTFSPDALKRFLHTNHVSASDRYEAYLARRKAGGPRELWPTREHALEWIRLASPVKYVDGVWGAGVLENINDAYRHPGKIAWQVVSEEFGDGDIGKNHIFVYHQLMESLGLGAVDSTTGRALQGHQAGFDGLMPEQGVPRCWKAAVAQQCVGILASEFFPEALGFNMAYEALPYHLMIESYELRELKIDDYYFALHITIDNADSGHAAMGRIAVEQYLSQVEAAEGVAKRDEMWRRVQAGVVLADTLPTTPWGPRQFDPHTWTPVADSLPPPTKLENAVAALFLRKAPASAKMHCTSRIRIGGRSLESWLDPAAIDIQRSLDFVRCLSGKDRIRAGSRLMKEIEWGGRMFGAFTKSETELLRQWWSSTDAARPLADPKGAYQRYTGRTDTVSDNQMSVDLDCSTEKPYSSLWQIADHPIAGDSAARLFPLWHLSTTLLERLPLSPARLATPDGMIALRILRAQLGYLDLHDTEHICAGVDDAVAERVIDLRKIRHHVQPTTRSEATANVARLADQLRSRRTRPYANLPWLFGVISGLEAWLYSDPITIETVKGTDLSAPLLRTGRDVRQALDDWERDDAADQRFQAGIMAVRRCIV